MATHKKRGERCLFRGFHKCLVAVGDLVSNKHTHKIIVSSHKTLRWAESQLLRLVLKLKSIHDRGFQVELRERGPFNYFLLQYYCSEISYLGIMRSLCLAGLCAPIFWISHFT
jgi:hypothetical protein